MHRILGFSLFDFTSKMHLVLLLSKSSTNSLTRRGCHECMKEEINYSTFSEWLSHDDDDDGMRNSL